MPSHNATTGERLFALVEDYASFGDHRTGSDVDHATAAWMADQLRARGLMVDVDRVQFQRESSTSQLLADGVPIEHLSVPYEFSGKIDTSNIYVESIDPKAGGFVDVLDEPLARAKATGADAAVFATRHQHGSLVAINRTIHGESEIPTLLVAGRDLDSLEGVDLRCHVTAERLPGHTNNVVGRSTGSAEPHIMLTTPLNGWFGCAAERGSGIAVLLELIDRLADQNLLVLATGGHELSYFGAFDWVARATETPRAVVHLGASVAAEATSEDGQRTLAMTRFAMTSLEEEDASLLRPRLQEVNMKLHHAVDHYTGEGEAFCLLGAPMLSVTGMGVDFHTPEDTPSRATSPEALEKMADALETTIATFVSLVGDE